MPWEAANAGGYLHEKAPPGTSSTRPPRHPLMPPPRSLQLPCDEHPLHRGRPPRGLRGRARPRRLPVENSRRVWEGRGAVGGLPRARVPCVPEGGEGRAGALGEGAGGPEAREGGATAYPCHAGSGAPPRPSWPQGAGEGAARPGSHPAERTVTVGRGQGTLGAARPLAAQGATGSLLDREPRQTRVP